MTGADLVSSGVAKVVTELRKHEDPEVRDRAGALRNQWKAVVVSSRGRWLCPTCGDTVMILGWCCSCKKLVRRGQTDPLC